MKAIFPPLPQQLFRLHKAMLRVWVPCRIFVSFDDIKAESGR